MMRNPAHRITEQAHHYQARRHDRQAVRALLEMAETSPGAASELVALRRRAGSGSTFDL